MVKRVRGTTPTVESAAVDLRQRSTPAERVLWEALRDRRLDGLKFRRQYPIGPFVLDFCCPAHRLAVEVDGDVHNLQVEQDQARTDHLTQYGYRVLRFHNDDVQRNLPSVLARILQSTSDP